MAKPTWEETVAAGVVFHLLQQSVPEAGLNIGVEAIGLSDGHIDVLTKRGTYRLTVTKIDDDNPA